MRRAPSGSSRASSARAFLESDDKLAFLQVLAEKGDLIANPVPDVLAPWNARDIALIPAARAPRVHAPPSMCS